MTKLRLSYHVKSTIYLEVADYLNMGLSYDEIRKVIAGMRGPLSPSSYNLHDGLTAGSVETWATHFDDVHLVAEVVHHKLIHVAWKKKGEN